MAQSNYDSITKIVKNHFNLGLSEAKLFVRLMERKRFTLDDVKAILKEIKETKANSRAYQLVTALKKEDLIEEIKKSNPKTYKPMHPTIVYNKIKKEQEDLDTSFGIIEQAYETFVESGSDLTSCFDIVASEGMILNKLQELFLKGYAISRIVSNDAYMINLLAKVSDKNYTKLKEKGQANYAIFEKNRRDKVFFAVCNIAPLSGKTKKEAIFIFDNNFTSELEKRR